VLFRSEPVSLRDQLGPPEPDAEADPDENEIVLQKLAFEVCVRINRVTSITPSSLLTLALLGTGARALTVDEARVGLSNLLRYVELRKLPATAQCFELDTNAGVQRALEALAENGVVTRFEGGPEVVYRIRQEQQLAASYYRNTIIHFFVNAGIAELAVLHVSEGSDDDPVEAFWQAVMRLRDLFKFEFFFAGKEEFRSEMREELAFHDADWEKRLEQGDAARLAKSFRPFTAHRVLRPFLECYRVVSDGLLRTTSSKRTDRDDFLDACLGLGKQYQLQQLIQSSASVSKALFTTALSLAEHRGLLDDDSPGIEARRTVFADEIRDAYRRVDMVDALATSRRAGLID
jgi:glycerol-3-phosphate O-acyltransferase